MKTLLPLLFLLMLAISATAQQGATIDFHDPVEEGNKTKVMILATPHLKQYQGSFRPTALDSLITLFRFWQPAIVGVEAQPPKVIAFQ